MKKTTIFLCAFLMTLMGFAQGHETFDNLDLEPTANSYADGSYVGDAGITWNYLQSRGDFDLNGRAIMLGRGRTPDAELTATIPGGIGTLEFSYYKAFSTDVEVEIYANGTLITTINGDGSTSEESPATTDLITVNVAGSVDLKFSNPNGGQAVIDDIIWTATGTEPTLGITSPSDGQEFAPGDSSIDVQFNITNFDISSSATSGDGDGYVQYNLDGGSFTDHFSTDPIELDNLDPGEHSIMVQLVDNNGDELSPAISDAVDFNINTVTEANSIGELRQGTIGSYYTLTSETVLTYQQNFRGQKYIQDDSGAILIDDDSGAITTTYNRYDGITGITGQLVASNGTLEIQPTSDSGAATSTDNVINPLVVTVDQFMSNPAAYESQLIAIQNVKFEDGDGTAEFAVGTDYIVTDGQNETTMRTNFYDADYIEDLIPQGVQDNLVGIAAQFSGAGQFFMRDSDDFNAELSVKSLTDSAVSIYPNPATSQITVQMEGSAQVEIFSILGQRVANKQISGNSSLSVENLTSGIYLVRISQEGQTLTKKLVVK